ncbi:Retrovirus-related Pol polyprotein from transposon 17.6, partial [Mucuna pruriens]
MDKIFEEIIGTDVEVYMDDMMVKSTTAGEHCSTLERVFQVLRKYHLKLNLEKCSFGVQARKFLGFMLIERGIEDDPEKCQAIINMRMKEVQQLAEIITALSQFLSRSVETTIPILNTLEKGESFVWTVESKEAFLRSKAMMATSPTLTKPTPGIPLLVYIYVFNDVVSAIIVQEREGKQHPINFISRVLQYAERRYQRIKKVALALIITSRRLCPYFQGYNIVVLRKPDLVGRMVA